MNIFLLISFLTISPASTKLLNTYEQNKVQYGEPISVESFDSKLGFTGFVTYSIDKDWKIKAFFINNKCRSEHMINHDGSKAKFDRNQVRLEANKMFDPAIRGAYKQKLDFVKVEGHFFDKGLVAYEYLLEGSRLIGYNGIKVLLYESDHDYIKINPKAYL
jgi:hypothetical protein